eukprot:10246881-Lingulodinium_polyedra.AAC.1
MPLLLGEVGAVGRREPGQREWIAVPSVASTDAGLRGLRGWLAGPVEKGGSRSVSLGQAVPPSTPAAPRGRHGPGPAGSAPPGA